MSYHHVAATFLASWTGYDTVMGGGSDDRYMNLLKSRWLTFTGYEFM